MKLLRKLGLRGCAYRFAVWVKDVGERVHWRALANAGIALRACVLEA